jgi:hypothetical protein
VLHSKNFVDEFDIIAVTETHLNSNVSDDDIKFESFSPKIMRRDRDGAADNKCKVKYKQQKYNINVWIYTL